MTQPIVQLSHHECIELLYGEVVGRVAVHTRVGTRIVPVNYAIVDDAIIWRTTPDSELAVLGAGLEGVFEVDHLDHDAQQGWSVIAYGTIEVVEQFKDVLDIYGVEDPAPWAEGLRPLYMRLPFTRLTGRRLGYSGHAAYPPTDVPPGELAAER